MATNTISRHKSKSYKINFLLNELERLAKQTQRCPICNCLIKWGFGSKKGSPAMNSPSLDRIDKSKILTIENIQIICFNCNATKRARTMKEFIEYCRMVSNKYK